MPASTQEWYIDTCYSGLQGGNRHLVRIHAHKDWPAREDFHRPRVDAFIVDLFLKENSNVVKARFSYNGLPVRRCGSGCIAAAHTLFIELGFSADFVLYTDWGRLPLIRKDSLCGFTTTSLPIHTGVNVEADLFDFQPYSWLHAGENDDYLVAVFEHDSAVRQLKPDLEAICRSTRRAVIATAPSSQETEDFVVRYFAPQYGNAEDGATGSANVVLGHYWCAVLGKDYLHSRQLSISGGEFFIHALTEHPVKMTEPMVINLFGKAKSVQAHPVARLAGCAS